VPRRTAAAQRGAAIGREGVDHAGARLKKQDIHHLPSPVWVGSHDPHRLDADGDGVGCDVN
jgi:hypothetical protein